MLALTCDGAGCHKPAVVWYIPDGIAECEDHRSDSAGLTENDFGPPRHTLGSEMAYDSEGRYTGVRPRQPLN